MPVARMAVAMAREILRVMALSKGSLFRSFGGLVAAVCMTTFAEIDPLALSRTRQGKN